MLDVPDILWGYSEQSNYPHLICSLFEQTPHGRILKKYIFRTNNHRRQPNMYKGLLTLVRELQLVEL